MADEPDVGSFAEQCSVTTIDTKSLATTQQTFPVKDAAECGARGRLAAEFGPESRMVIAEANRAPLQPVQTVHLRDPEAGSLGRPGPVRSLEVDQRRGELRVDDPNKPGTNYTPIGSTAPAPFK